MQISIKGTAQNRCNIQDAFCLHVILAIPQCFQTYKGSVYLKLFYQTSLQRQLPYKQTFLFSMGFSIYQVTLLSFAWLAWDTKQASQVIVSNLKKTQPLRCHCDLGIPVPKERRSANTGHFWVHLLATENEYRKLPIIISPALRQPLQGILGGPTNGTKKGVLNKLHSSADQNTC